MKLNITPEPRALRAETSRRRRKPPANRRVAVCWTDTRTGKPWRPATFKAAMDEQRQEYIARIKELAKDPTNFPGGVEAHCKGTDPEHLLKNIETNPASPTKETPEPPETQPVAP